MTSRKTCFASGLDGDGYRCWGKRGSWGRWDVGRVSREWLPVQWEREKKKKEEEKEYEMEEYKKTRKKENKDKSEEEKDEVKEEKKV